MSNSIWRSSIYIYPFETKNLNNTFLNIFETHLYIYIHMITSVIYVLHIIIVVPHSVDGMVLQDGALSHLDLLIQKSMCYKHQKENYIKSLEEGITPSGLQINKNQLFYPFQNILKVSGMTFCMKQKRIL